MTVRTRFAPSPTGELHLGNARTAVLNWAFARHHGGEFVLRVEDTDVDREAEGALDSILEGLRWLELEPDEGPEQGGPHGPYRQSERGSLYRDRAAGLLLDGRAYNCYCTPEELRARREEAGGRGERPVYDGRCRGLEPEEEERLRDEGRRPSVRFRTPAGAVHFEDRVRGEISIDAGEFGDFVVLRSDGRPTYNFAVVVDDVEMEISHVIRGAGHLSNTPKQVLLYGALDEPVPEFVHVPLVLGPGGESLSKRTGARGLLAYRDEGFHPDAVVNYLSLLSWSSPSGDEVLSRERIVGEMDLDRVGASDAELDPEKMAWLSGEHLRGEPPARLARRLAPFLEEARDEGGFRLDERDLLAVAEVAGERIRLFTEAAEEAAAVFPEPAPTGEALDALEGTGAAEVLPTVARAWAALDGWERAALGASLDEVRAEVGPGGRAFYQPLRAALTGRLEGPALPDVAYMLGRERTLARLRGAADV